MNIDITHHEYTQTYEKRALVMAMSIGGLPLSSEILPEVTAMLVI